MPTDRNLRRLLGRHQEHDPRSRQFPAAQASHLHDADWAYHGRILDQGQLGSCTGHAAVEVLMSGPYYAAIGKVFVEADALAVYEKATHLDRIPGTYPPDDTGSSGLAVMRACKQAGWIAAYHHAFGLSHALAALMLGPVITGTVWMDEMFNPDKDGFVHLGGKVAGGHEYCVVGYRAADQSIECLNSWGTGWGLAGRFRLKADDWGVLLEQGGDVTVPAV